MYDRRAIITAAWNRYRAAYGTYAKFYRECFREALRIEWKLAKRAASVVVKVRSVVVPSALLEPVQMSPMEARIDALKYLPFSFDIGAMAAEIRAEYRAA